MHKMQERKTKTQRNNKRNRTTGYTHNATLCHRSHWKGRLKVPDQISSQSVLPEPISFTELWAIRLPTHRRQAEPRHPTPNARGKSILHGCCATYWKLIRVAITTTGTICSRGFQCSTSSVASNQALHDHILRRDSLSTAGGWGHSHMALGTCSKNMFFVAQEIEM